MAQPKDTDSLRTHVAGSDISVASSGGTCFLGGRDPKGQLCQHSCEVAGISPGLPPARGAEGRRTKPLPTEKILRLLAH